MKPLLILGNGISRLDHKDFINHWRDEIWGCNRIFYEYYKKEIPRLDIVLGDYAALLEAIEYKKEYGGDYKLYGKSNKEWVVALEEQNVTILNIPEDLQKDTGTTLVSTALLWGYDKIYIAGFDLGGPDIYMNKHELRNKSNWIENWRNLDKKFGLDKIEFLGKNHKSFIQSNASIDSYANLYTKNKNHLNKKVLILGNGISRREKQNEDFIKNWYEEIWGCNGAYKESFPFTRIGLLDKKILKEVLEYKDKNKRTYDVFYKKELKNKTKKFFYAQKGGNTGYQLILQALYEGFDEIYLLGFDFGGSDIYTETKNGSVFQKRFKEIIDEFGMNKIYFVNGMPDFLC